MDKKNHSFVRSLHYAVKGFCDALHYERNLRFHFCVGNLICFFAAFYGISSVEWAVLLLTVGFVISAELFNSAVEMAVDTATTEIRDEAGHAKDYGAAATLVSAIFSIAVGIALFGNITKIISALTGIFTSVRGVVILIVLIIIDVRVLLLKK